MTTELELSAAAQATARDSQAQAARAALAAGLAATVTAQEGDTLASLAAAIYGSTDAAAALFDANRDVIGSTPANVTPGLVLRIPLPPATPAPVQPAGLAGQA